MKKFDNAKQAWMWIMEHPKMAGEGLEFLDPWISLEPQLVNPETDCIDDDGSLNTAMRWWIEGGHYYLDDDGHMVAFLDTDLDDGGNTADEAVIKFANNVYKKFGDYDENS